MEVLRQLYLANLPSDKRIPSDQEEESNALQTLSENHQVPSVPAVMTATSSALDRQRPLVTSAAAEGFSSLGNESRRNNTTDLQNVNNEALHCDQLPKHFQYFKINVKTSQYCRNC